MDVSDLTSEQLEELHQALERDRLRLEEHLLLTKEGSKPIQLGTPIGRLSRMDAIQQQQVSQAFIHQRRAPLAGINKQPRNGRLVDAGHAGRSADGATFEQGRQHSEFPGGFQDVHGGPLSEPTAEAYTQNWLHGCNPEPLRGSGLRGARCSNTGHPKFFDGRGGGLRTLNFPLSRRALYPLELPPGIFFSSERNVVFGGNGKEKRDLLAT